ncbi:MAG: hypothetical protein GWP05_03495 [Anaerolineaceae bacterium]|nr:hypothetical protein [Anaerolineaceae bacterium]
MALWALAGQASATEPYYAWAWGSGSLGQLGNGTWDNSLTPVFLFGINGAAEPGDVQILMNILNSIPVP